VSLQANRKPGYFSQTLFEMFLFPAEIPQTSQAQQKGWI